MAKLKSGHEIAPLTSEEQVHLDKLFVGQRIGLIRLKPGGFVVSTPFKHLANEIHDFKIKSTDVFIMSYPKCGTTWTQEVVWTMLKNPNLDNPDASLQLGIRSPFLECDFLFKHYDVKYPGPGNTLYNYLTSKFPEREVGDRMYRQLTEVSPEPRVIKTHLTFDLLPPNILDTCKVVYIARDPKDACDSYLHHCRLLNIHGFVGTTEEFVNCFVNDQLIFGPFWSHIQNGWTRRNSSNVHFIFYENMKKNPISEILRLQEFLGTNLTDKQIADIAEYTSFGSMKSRNAFIPSSGMNKEEFEKEGGFFRKGESGTWKSKLTKEQAKKIEEWTKKMTSNFGPDFKYGKEEL